MAVQSSDLPGPRQTSSSPLRRLGEEVLKLYRAFAALRRLERDRPLTEVAHELCKALQADGVSVRLGLELATVGCVEGLFVEGSVDQGQVTVFRAQGPLGIDRQLAHLVASWLSLRRRLMNTEASVLSAEQQISVLRSRAEAAAGLGTEVILGVSHELRTPLASIKGFASTVTRDGAMPPETVRAFVKIIDQEADKLILLVDDLLDVSRMLSGQMRYRLVCLRLDQLSQELCGTLAPIAQEKGLCLEVTALDPCPVMADRGAITRVLTNLIGNALKFTERGEVRLNSWADEREVHLSVSDTGIGIPPDALPRLFQRFFRVESHVRAQEGLGLGLALVKGIVEDHGGVVEVTSQLGQGSTFTLRLPRAEAR